MIVRVLRPIIAVICVGLAVWQTNLLVAQLGDRNATPDIETAPVKRGAFVVGITRDGVVESADVEPVRAPAMQSSILTWVADDGQRVKKGDLVAKLDVTQFRFQVEQSRLQYQNQVAQVGQEKRNKERDFESAQLDVAKNRRGLDVLSRSLFTETEQGQAQVGYDRWNLTFAQTDYDKQRRLNQAGIVPGTQLDQSQRSVRSKEYALGKSEKEVSYLDAQHAVKTSQSSADISTAEFNKELARRRITEAVQSARESARMSGRQLEEMERNLAHGELRATKEGVVVLASTWDQSGQRALREGDQVWPEMKICDITNLETLQLAIRVDEASASRLKAGQEAVITMKGIAGRKFKGEVKSIGAVARRVMFWEDPEALPDQRVFDVTVKILDADKKLLRPGMKAKVQFVVRWIRHATYVPIEAVFDRPPRGEFAYLQHGRRFDARRVRTGEKNDEAVVIQKGLRRGERVALSDPTKVEGK